jgi:hypothetical protein
MTDKLKAVADLRGYDHVFISAEGVQRFAEAFGLEGKITPTLHYATPQEPKGLTLANGAKSATGMDASVLAATICRLLNVQYEDKMGRGSRLRSCCDALARYYSRSK